MKISAVYAKHKLWIRFIISWWFFIASFNIVAYELFEIEQLYNLSLFMFKWWFIVLTPPVFIVGYLHSNHGRRIERIKMNVFNFTGRKITTKDINSIVYAK